MGRGIKAGKKKEITPNKNFMLMEEAYREGYSKGIEKGYCQGKDDYLGLSNLLFRAATAKEFGWGQEEFEILEKSIDKITSNANERGIDVVALNEELRSSIENEEDEIMSGKAKYSEDKYINLIESGLDNKEIFKKLNVPTGSQTRVGKHIDNLRKTHGALEVHIKEPAKEVITEAEGINYGKAKAQEIIEKNRIDVDNIMSSIENKNKALKGESVEDMFKKKPAIINPEFEAAVQDMFPPKKTPEGTVDDVAPVIAQDIDPAYSFDGTVKAPCETSAAVGVINFREKAELAFKRDMDAYSDKVSMLTEKLNSGEIIDLADIVEYNKIAEKYRGVYADEAAIATM
ncbi:hypothetical protein [Aminipila sp.]|uniref:hypothetical protein n=1 Tax=Aminipila sp. TaxID=2060095 RepID=UPI00289F770C|nr:hypothetical protein [Aminipila sp.]